MDSQGSSAPVTIIADELVWDHQVDVVVVYDGYSECWFADRAASGRVVASESWARLEQDAATLFDIEAMANGMSAVLDERVIRDHES